MWSKFTKRAFEPVPLESTYESCLYAWKRLLHLLFDTTKGYEIGSAHLEQGSQTNGIERSVYYIVRADGCPVFFIEINPFAHLNSISTRAMASQHMRQRFAELKEDLKIGRLYGISCMGPQFGIWSMDSHSGEVSPNPVQPSMTHVIDTAPRTWWTQHVLEESGHQHLESLAQNVYDMVATAMMPRAPYPHRRTVLRSTAVDENQQVNLPQPQEQFTPVCVDNIVTWEQTAQHHLSRPTLRTGLSKEFELLPLESTPESCLYAWKRELHLLFDSTKGYEVSPAYLEQSSPQANVLECSVYYIVRADGCPVFFIEINPFAHLNSISTRAMASQHMRQRFTELKEDLKIGRLYGISCMGPQFGIWSMDSHSGEVSPNPVQSSMTHVIDTAPRTWWTRHLEKSGHQHLESLARNVYNMVATAKIPRASYPQRRNDLRSTAVDENQQLHEDVGDSTVAQERSTPIVLPTQIMGYILSPE